MGKLSEYLKLLPKGIQNLDKIIDGLKNEVRMEFGTIKPEHEEIIIARRLICNECPYLSTNAKKAGWYAPARTDEHCVMCGCPKNIRTAALDANCGIEDYNEREKPETPLELKWTKIADDEY